jgi:hypothetical protein
MVIDSFVQLLRPHLLLTNGTFTLRVTYLCLCTSNKGNFGWLSGLL